MREIEPGRCLLPVQVFLLLRKGGPVSYRPLTCMLDRGREPRSAVPSIVPCLTLGSWKLPPPERSRYRGHSLLVYSLLGEEKRGKRRTADGKESEEETMPTDMGRLKRGTTIGRGKKGGKRRRRSWGEIL